MPIKDPVARRRYHREWMARRRAEYFADKSCAVCESTAQLELDHIDPTQKVSHRIFGLTAERQAQELAKCQVLCHDCHQRKSAEESRKRNYIRYHGVAA